MIDATETRLERLKARLSGCGLRPTRKRVALADLAFADGDRHWTAEGLYASATRAGLGVSLATVYNTLNQFARAGLVRPISMDAGRTFFDTNTSAHHHYYLEEDGRLIDIPADQVRVSGVTAPPEGGDIARIDVIVRIARPR